MGIEHKDDDAVAIPSRSELVRLGDMPDPVAPAFTRAGRSLQKHGYRPGSFYPRVSGPPSHYNGIAQRILVQIVESPDCTFELKTRVRFGSVVLCLEVVSSGGRKVGYDWDNQKQAFQFEGFREPLRVRPSRLGNQSESKTRRMSALTMTIASWADRDDLVIEIDDGDEQLGLVTYDPDRGEPVIAVYGRQTAEEWRYSLDDLIAILTVAREEIIAAAGPVAREAMQAANAALQSTAAH